MRPLPPMTTIFISSLLSLLRGESVVAPIELLS